MTDLNTLAEHIHITATRSGFWPTDREDALASLDVLGGAVKNMPQRTALLEDVEVVRRYVAAQEVRNMGEMLMLMTSELAEALEEHRDGHDPVWYKAVIPEVPTDMDQSGWSAEAKEAYNKLRYGAGGDITKRDHEALVNVGVLKPEGLAVELADCIIRCLDTMQSLGVDVEEVVTEKMRFNVSRPFKHGKAY